MCLLKAVITGADRSSQYKQTAANFLFSFLKFFFLLFSLFNLLNFFFHFFIFFFFFFSFLI